MDNKKKSNPPKKEISEDESEEFMLKQCLLLRKAVEHLMIERKLDLMEL